MVKGVAQGKLSEEKILDRPSEDAKAWPSFRAVFVTSAVHPKVCALLGLCF